MSYDGSLGDSVVDDKGEAYYYIAGTDKAFVIEARTNLDDEGVPVPC
jgi:hypothetical protein